MGAAPWPVLDSSGLFHTKYRTVGVFQIKSFNWPHSISQIPFVQECLLAFVDVYYFSAGAQRPTFPIIECPVIWKAPITRSKFLQVKQGTTDPYTNHVGQTEHPRPRPSVILGNEGIKENRNFAELQLLMREYFISIFWCPLSIFLGPWIRLKFSL